MMVMEVPWPVLLDHDRRGLHGDEAFGHDRPALGVQRRAEASEEEGEGRRFLLRNEEYGVRIQIIHAQYDTKRDHYT